MYGTIFRMKIIPGKESKLIELAVNWNEHERQTVDGAVATYFMKPDNSPGEIIGMAVFRYKAAYLANGDNPLQHERFMKFRELMIEDPEWTDGEFVSS